MTEIKILKSFEDKVKKQDIQKVMSSFPRKNRASTPDAWVLKFEKSDEFLGAIVQLASRMCEFKLSDIIFDFCVSQQMTQEECKKFIDAFFIYSGEFLEYSINVTTMMLRLYFENNDTLNMEAFLLFNMNLLGKELRDKLSNPEILDSISGIMGSSILDKISILQTIAEAQEILENTETEIEKVKDFKIYFENGIKCISDRKVIIDRKYFNDKYDIFIEEDFSDIEVIVILAALMIPERVILFKSINEVDRKKIADLINVICPICGEIKIFSADDDFPR